MKEQTTPQEKALENLTTKKYEAITIRFKLKGDKAATEALLKVLLNSLQYAVSNNFYFQGVFEEVMEE